MGQLQLLLEQANQALGRLDGFTSVLPDLSLFLYPYVRKEALLSSQIEGTQPCANPWYAQTARRVSTFAQAHS